MATIDYRRPHQLTRTQARTLAEDLARRIEARHSVRWRWEGDALELTAPPGPAHGTRGLVTLHEHDLHIEVELPFTLRPAKRLVESQLRRRIDALLQAREASNER